MRTWIKAALASLALGGLLAGCASYDYGYAYSEPYYYGYGYDYGPQYYDYYGYPYYGPAYYGAPAIGFNFGYRDFDRHGHGERRHFNHRSRNDTAQHRANSRPAPVNQASRPRPRGHVATTTRNRVPAAPAPQRAQRSGGGHRPAQATMRAEQQ